MKRHKFELFGFLVFVAVASRFMLAGSPVASPTASATPAAPKPAVARTPGRAMVPRPRWDPNGPPVRLNYKVQGDDLIVEEVVQRDTVLVHTSTHALDSLCLLTLPAIITIPGTSYVNVFHALGPPTSALKIGLIWKLKTIYRARPSDKVRPGDKESESDFLKIYFKDGEAVDITPCNEKGDAVGLEFVEVDIIARQILKK